MIIAFAGAPPNCRPPVPCLFSSSVEIFNYAGAKPGASRPDLMSYCDIFPARVGVYHTAITSSFCSVSTVGCGTAPARCPPLKVCPRHAAGGAQRPRHPIQTLLELRKVRRARGPGSFPLLPLRGRITVWRHHDSCGNIMAGVRNQALACPRPGRRPAAAPQPRSGTSQIRLALLSREAEQECSPWRKAVGKCADGVAKAKRARISVARPGKIWEQPFQPEEMGEAAVEAPDL